jgi:succinate-acetate transporter protein
MENKFPGAITLGYATLFISFWLWYMGYAGWVAVSSMTDFVPTMMILGGAVLAIAGIFSFFNRDNVETVLFFVIAAYAFAFALRFIMYPALPANSNPAATDAWSHIVLAVVIFCLWYASLGGKALRQLFLLALWLTELGAAIFNWTSANIFALIAGYIGLIAAIFAGLYFASILLSKKEVGTA